VRLRFWGTRGSIPTPGPETNRFGGNTPCVQVTGADGTELILDAGSGIRPAGAALAGSGKPLHVLLTHLHLDHIQGLLFFAPFFDPEAEVTVWGPPGGGRRLRDRLARYLSTPLSPLEIRDLAARVRFEDAPSEPWRLGELELRAALVEHRGPTLGYRVEGGDASICYLPDHEPALGVELASTPASWISGLGLARGADVLIHDGQYFDREYPEHLGWGHSSVGHALDFAARAEASRLLLFHHDPGHDDDDLDALAAEVRERAQLAGGAELARDGQELLLGQAALAG
jgi:phosphoribosyl 1,2-cyclic phosphodiesterase